MLPRPRPWTQRVALAAVGLGTFLAVVWLVPHRYCGQGASSWYRGDKAIQGQLARTVSDWVESDLRHEHFSTGSRHFDGEWLFGTYTMAALGLGQIALEHPELRQLHAKVIAQCIQRILSDDVRAFDRDSWRQEPLANLERGSGHAAYLGYLNLALSMHRLLDPKSKYAALGDRITAALVRRIETSPLMLIDTYPNETYPVDNCAVMGSIGLHDRATGSDHRALMKRWGRRCRQAYVDAATGLLIQAVRSDNGRVLDGPRGSGTTLGLYLLSFADAELSRDLYRAVRRELVSTLLGFGMTREYPRGAAGSGDIDSGPIILGYGIAPSGFTLGGARLFRDEPVLRANFATAYLVGAPLQRGDRYEFVGGGPLGNAILLAMLTAQPIDTEVAP